MIANFPFRDKEVGGNFGVEEKKLLPLHFTIWISLSLQF